MPVTDQFWTGYLLTEGSDVLSTPSLFTFTRNVPTVDPLGAQVAADTPRFGPDQTLAGIGSGPTTLNLRTGSAVAEFFGEATVHAGLDVDGKVLIVVRDFPTVSGVAHVRLRAWVETAANTWAERGERICYRPTGYSVAGRGDLRYTTGAPPASDDGKLFDPRCIQVFNGSIIVHCEVYRKTGSPASWATPESIGIGWVVFSSNDSAYATDYVNCPPYLYDDASLANNPGRTRGAAWSFTNVYAPFHSSGAILEAWPCGVDYQFGNDASNNIFPNGGVAYWFKMTRASGSLRFTPALTGSAIRVARQSPGPLSLATPYGRYMHRHQIALVKQLGSTDKLVAVMAEGDGSISSITRIFNIDRSDYDNASLWNVQYDQHGRMDSSARSGPTPPARKGDNRSGNQFVAACPGPDAGQLLVGSDRGHCGIDILQIGVPDAGSGQPTRLRHTTVHSRSGTERTSYDDLDGATSGRTLAGWTGRQPNIFHLKADKLEDADRLVLGSVDFADPNAATHGAWPALVRYAISTSSGREGTWSDFQPPVEVDAGHVDEAGNVHPSHLDGAGIQLAAGEMYARSTVNDATNKCSILRFGFGNTLAGRPLLVSPARANYWHGAALPQIASNGEWVECFKNAAGFRTVLPNGTPGAALALQPPIWHNPSVTDGSSIGTQPERGRVYRLKVTKKLGDAAGVGSDFVLAVNPGAGRVDGGAYTQNQFRSGWGNGTGNYTGGLTARIWILNTSDDVGGHLATHSPPLPPSIPALRLQWESGSSYTNGEIVIASAENIATNNAWIPICFQGPISKSSSSYETLSLTQTFDSVLNSDIEVYVAIDMLSPGYGCWGYPTPPAPTGSSAIAGAQPVSPAYPNELAKLVGLPLPTTEWTAIVAGCVSDDDWDQFVYGAADRNAAFPLFTLWGDANNHTVVSASPWIESAVPSGGGAAVISRHSRLTFTTTRFINNSYLGNAGAIEQAVFLRRAPVLIALVWNGSVLKAYAATGGTYLGSATIAVASSGHPSLPLNNIRFFDNGGGVGAFQWFGAGTFPGALSEADVKTAMTTLEFISNA